MKNIQVYSNEQYYIYKHKLTTTKINTHYILHNTQIFNNENLLKSNENLLKSKSFSFPLFCVYNIQLTLLQAYTQVGWYVKAMRKRFQFSFNSDKEKKQSIQII